jgi:hypothetical protein
MPCLPATDNRRGARSDNLAAGADAPERPRHVAEPVSRHLIFVVAQTELVGIEAASMS